MPSVENSAASLKAHITGTYLGLRIGIGVIAIILPWLLWVGGRLADGDPLMPSMSDYYYSSMRDTFVGALVAIGLFLYLYKGFSTKENVALNIAGVLAVAVALIPTAPPDASGKAFLSVHAACAVLFFVGVAYVCIFRAPDTLSLIRDSETARLFRFVYRCFGAAMIALPVTAVAVAAVLRPSSITFILEATAVWVFAAYWLVKSMEIKRSDAEHLALEGKLQALPGTTRPARFPGRLAQIEPAGDREHWDARAVLNTSQNV